MACDIRVHTIRAVSSGSGRFVAEGLKALYFIALRLEDEPFTGVSVKLEGTAKCPALLACRGLQLSVIL